jgi:putative ABC transport system permease protein
MDERGIAAVMRFVTFLWKNLFRRKVRSMLTCFGVAVAVGTMVALLGIADGFERSAEEAFTKRGVDLVVMAEGKSDPLNSDIDQRVGDRIRQLPGVKAVAPGLVELVEYKLRTTAHSAMVNGWELDSFLFDDLRVLQGRRLQPQDHRALMLGENLAQNIHKNVGDTIEIQGDNFRVVGIYQSFSVYENGAAVLRLDELQDLMARKQHVTGFSVVLEKSGHGPSVETVRDEIKNLRDEKGRPLRLSAMTTIDYVNNFMYLRLARAMAWLTSAIAVVIGTIGMLNTMIMSVFERVREIGILRAIGWRKSRVVRMILGESMLLSLAGALLGMIGAIVLTWGLTRVAVVSGYIRGDLAPIVFAEGFVMAMAVGLIGGLYPAYRAARLLPTEALRHE